MVEAIKAAGCGKRAPRVGDIWKDNDPRKDRYIRVFAVSGDSVTIKTCDSNGFPTIPGVSYGVTRLERFGGFRRNQFRFVKAFGGEPPP